MRVLFVNPVGTIGGAERVLLRCLTSLKNDVDGVEPILLVLDEGPLLDAVRSLGIKAVSLPLPPTLTAWGDSGERSIGRLRRWMRFLLHGISAAPAICKYLARLRVAIRQLSPDLIHSNGVKTHLLLGLSRPRRVPVVWHVHDFYSLRPLAEKLLRFASRGAKSAIAISDAVASDLKHGFPGLPMVTIKNTVDVEHFSPRPADRERLDVLAGLDKLPANGFRIGLVATYARWKGHEVFLRAAAELALARPDWPIRWYIIGGPIYRTSAQYTLLELRNLATNLGIAERVAFIPFQQDPAEIYRALDVVVHASTLPEPFGLTIAEAMACGRAVIVSSAGGATEVFTPGEEAIAVQPGDARGMASEIVELLENPERRIQLGDAARRRVERDFHPNRLGRQLLNLYRNCLTAREFSTPE